MPLHAPRAHRRLSAPELQALCEAHARALSRLRQDKRDPLCAIGMGFGMRLRGSVPRCAGRRRLAWG